MKRLIEDLLAFSRLDAADREYESTDLKKLITEVKIELREVIEEKNAIIEAAELCTVNIIPFQFRQLMHNLINNSLKFSDPKKHPHINIKSKIEKHMLNEFHQPTYLQTPLLAAVFYYHCLRFV